MHISILFVLDNSDNLDNSDLNIPKSNGAGLSLSSEEVEEDQVFVVPVNLEVVVGGEFWELSQVLLNFVHVPGRDELCHRTLGVGEESPALEVAGHNVPPHLESSLPHSPPVPCLCPVTAACIVEL